MKTQIIPIFTFLTILLKCSDSARILGAVFTPSYSHQVAFHPIWKALSQRGHHLTILTTNPINDPTLTNLTEIDLSMSYNIMKQYKTDELLSNTTESVVSRYKKYMEALNYVADRQLAHPQVQNLIHKNRNDFDLLMVEAIYPTQMALSWWFNVPFIGMISLDAPSRIHSAMGNPVHPVLYPDYDLPFDKNLTFWERLISVIFFLFMRFYTEFRLHPREDATVKKYFGPEAPLLNDIQKNMSLLFVNVNPVFNNVRPLGPATIQIGGGIHLQEAEPLPRDIQEYLDGAIDGFVYFSLGTNVKSASLSLNTTEAMLEALSRLPYKVLWKFEKESIANKPDNVKMVQWVPQIGILAHPNIKVFITQCGLQSMEEAIFYHVPMVGLPFYGDQGKNCKVLESKGLGIRLQPTYLTQQEFYSAIIETATKPYYRENLQEISELLKDQIISGLDKAVWWTEYVLRHKGAKHLRSSAIDVPMYQVLCLDIIAFFLTIFLIILLIIKIIFRIFNKVIKKKNKTE